MRIRDQVAACLLLSAVLYDAEAYFELGVRSVMTSCVTHVPVSYSFDSWPFIAICT